MKNTNLKFLFSILIMIITGCSGAKVTFQTVYSTELEEKQNEGGHFNESSNKFVGVAGSGIINTKSFTVLNMEDGDILYTKSAKEMGTDVAASPEYIIDFDQQVIFLYSSYLTHNTLAAVDLNSGKELWNKTSKNEGVGEIAYDFNINWFGGLPVMDGNKLKIYNSRTGNVKWTLNAAKGINVNEAYEKGKSNWTYWNEKNLLLVSIDNQLGAIDTKKGDIQWTISGEYGNLNECDLFLEMNRALFYGPQGGGAAETIGKELMRSSSTVGRVAGRAIRASNSGIQDNPLYYIDLENGKLLWETSFKTSGQTYPIFYDDVLILSDLFTYALDEKTGEVLWQTVTEERLENEENRRLISEFTPFQLDASNRRANDNIIVDDNIFVVHSTIFDKDGNKESVSLKRLNIRTGEEIWASEPEKITITNFFFKNGRLFVHTGNRMLYPNGEMRALSAGTGELLYEIKAKSTIIQPFITDYYIHFRDFNSQLKSYDVNTGKQVDLKTPLPQTHSLEYANNFLLGKFSSYMGSGSLLAFINPKTFEVERSVEIPFSPANKVVKEDYLYLHERTDNSLEIISIDFDQLENRGTFRKRSNVKKTQNGQSVDTMPDVHYQISQDGKNIYVTDKEVFTKYKLKE